MHIVRDATAAIVSLKGWGSGRSRRESARSVRQPRRPPQIPRPSPMAEYVK